VPETTWDGRDPAELLETGIGTSAAHLSRTALAVIDQRRNIVYANPAFSRMGLDLARDDIVLAAEVPGLDGAPTSTGDLGSAVRSGQVYAGEWRRLGDVAKWMPVVVEPIPGRIGIESVVSILDLDQWHAAGRPLAVGQLDSVTGLCTRQSFLRVLERVCSETRRGRASVGLVFIDLDAFKAINDSHGHLVGDRSLASVARSITASVRPDDVVARFGGDEFVVLCRELGPPDCAGLAERIHRAIGRTEPAIGGLSASLGIAVGAPPIRATSLLDAADQAMYRAKRTGPGRTELTSVVANRPD
jgi:diguanylate cyclase (GGDEF)-like protein